MYIDDKTVEEIVIRQRRIERGVQLLIKALCGTKAGTAQASSWNVTESIEMSHFINSHLETDNS